MKKLLIIFALLLCSSPALAQNKTCPTRPAGDATNACASTAFVATAIGPSCTVFSSVVSGCVPASGGGTTNFLRADGTWASPTGSGIVYYNCTNTAGDSAALAVAIAAAEAIGGAGGILHISGTCSLTSALTATTNVTIEGDGMNQTFLTPTAVGTVCINFNPSGANKTLNIRKLTCTYGSLSSSNGTGVQYGNASFNNIGGVIEEFDCTNCGTGISLLNGINVVIAHSTISPFYYTGIVVSNPILPDSGGNVIHDNYIQVFAPLTSGTIGVQWLSGGAFDLHDNQIFAPNPVVLSESLQTSELHVHHNLLVGAGATPTAGIQLNTTSATFTCTQSGTNMTVSGVTGSILFHATGGPTVYGTGVAVGTHIVSQTSGTPNGAGVYVTSATGTASSASCRSTFVMTELIIDGNIFDNTVRPLYIPSNIGGQWNNNTIFSNNTISSDNNSSTNQVTFYHTTGFTISGNLFLCNGTCTGGRPIVTDVTSANGLIVQGPSTEIGSWSAADVINSTVTTIVGDPKPTTNALGGNVALNNTGNFFDGPSVAQGTTSTWFASGIVTLQDTAGAATFICKLWDGTTVIASGRTLSNGASQFITMSLSGFITAPAANIKISCNDPTSTSGLIIANASGAGKDSTITVTRLY